MLRPDRGAAAGLAAFVMLLASPAHAGEPKTSSLSWVRMPGADECIATQPLARAVEERLGRTVFVSAAQADLSIEGRIEHRRGGWRSVITVRDPKGSLLGTREIERSDASCAAMSEPLALVIAVMIDPDAAMRRPEPEQAGSPTSTEPAEPAPPAPAQPATEPGPAAPAVPTDATATPPPPPPKKPWRFEGGGHLMAVAGLAPTVAWGAGVDGILYPPGIPVGFRGATTLFLPTTAERGGSGADFDMLLFGGSICPTLRGAVNVMACLGGHLGAMRPRPFGPAASTLSTDAIGIWNATAEVRASYHVVPPIAVGAGVGGALPLVRPRYGDLHESSIVALTADLALGFFFP